MASLSERIAHNKAIAARLASLATKPNPFPVSEYLERTLERIERMEKHLEESKS